MLYWSIVIAAGSCSPCVSATPGGSLDQGAVAAYHDWLGIGLTKRRTSAFSLMVDHPLVIGSARGICEQLSLRVSTIVSRINIYRNKC
ncbi:MAG: hypothetical protein CL912_29180 [Deltaproteobacteria bacterium]|nr:hypothetical protein [Deltaproteobacteria bacterium]|tara:strand:+ start:376 stop:639 length:264 start_codon:yes stop_codon:yes gene_type:complete